MDKNWLFKTNLLNTQFPLLKFSDRSTSLPGTDVPARGDGEDDEVVECHKTDGQI